MVMMITLGLHGRQTTSTQKHAIALHNPVGTCTKAPMLLLLRSVLTTSKLLFAKAKTPEAEEPLPNK